MVRFILEISRLRMMSALRKVKATPGFTPADIGNVMNDSGLCLLPKRATMSLDFEMIKASIIKVIAGLEKKSRVQLEKERKLTAYHEAMMLCWRTCCLIRIRFLM